MRTIYYVLDLATKTLVESFEGKGATIPTEASTTAKALAQRRGHALCVVQLREAHQHGPSEEIWICPRCKTKNRGFETSCKNSNCHYGDLWRRRG